MIRTSAAFPVQCGFSRQFAGYTATGHSLLLESVKLSKCHSQNTPLGYWFLLLKCLILRQTHQLLLPAVLFFTYSEKNKIILSHVFHRDLKSTTFHLVPDRTEHIQKHPLFFSHVCPIRTDNTTTPSPRGIKGGAVSESTRRSGQIRWLAICLFVFFFNVPLEIAKSCFTQLCLLWQTPATADSFAGFLVTHY